MRRETEEAAEIRRLKNTFFASLGRELRAVSYSLADANHLLQEELKKDNHAELLKLAEAVDKANIHMMNLANDTFDIARVDSGNLHLYPEQVDVAALLDQIVTLFQDSGITDASRNHFLKDYSDDLGFMHVDKTILHQIIVNLLNNANKFTHQGTITLSARKEAGDEKETMSFWVQDTGIGIAPERIPTLMLPLASLQRDQKLILGLPLCRSLSELMGGSLSVESELGKDSTFRLVLPVEFVPPNTD